MKGEDSGTAGENPRPVGEVGWRLAQLACCCAVLAAVAALSAGFGSRLGLWHFRTGFAMLKWAAWGGVAAALAGGAALFLCVRQRRLAGGVLAALAMLAGLTVFLVPLQWRLAARRVPPIHDITTDIVKPPRFVAILPLRGDAPNPADYGGPEIAVQQRAAYPDLQTLVLNAPAEQAFGRALDTARRVGWRIIAEVPGEGRIEATDTTFWFGFTDDIVIRIVPAGHRSVVDIRSVSRVGRSDAGTNARRIRSFLRQLAASG